METSLKLSTPIFILTTVSHQYPSTMVICIFLPYMALYGAIQYLHDDCYYMKIQLIASVRPIDHQNPYTHPKHILQNMNSPSKLTISLRTKGYTEVQLNLTFF